MNRKAFERHLRARHLLVRAEHWAPPEVAAVEPNSWLAVGFYDDVAVRTPEGWRLSSIKLTLTHQENEALLAASMAAVKD